ncbi:MAG: hypothetical protein ACLS48_09770 [[Eubacterium] siraeum]
MVRPVDITDNGIVRSGCKPGNEEMINTCRDGAIWGDTALQELQMSKALKSVAGQQAEFADDSIFQIISKYVEISGKPYVLEMIYKIMTVFCRKLR